MDLDETNAQMFETGQAAMPCFEIAAARSEVKPAVGCFDGSRG